MFYFIISVDRLKQFFIRVGNDYNVTGYNPALRDLCWYEPNDFAIKETKAFDCTEPLVGRYVTIHFNRSEYLSLCEVEVYSDIGTCLICFYCTFESYLESVCSFHKRLTTDFHCVSIYPHM